MKEFFDLVPKRGIIFITYVGVAQGGQGDLKLTFSMICGQQSELESLCTIPRLRVDT